MMPLLLILLAGAVNDGRSGPPAPDPRAVQVDRHVDAHVPARVGESATSVPDDRLERGPAPDPARALQPPLSPPAIQLYRDPLYRDRRY